MAWQLAAGITEPETQFPIGGTCLAIKQVTLDHTAKKAWVACAIWTSKAAKDAGQPAVFDEGIYTAYYSDTDGADGSLYTPVFGDQPLTVLNNPVAAAAYAALPSHPALAAMLAGAVKA
jgi:hypothetical protein